jgi:hypothetical protein
LTPRVGVFQVDRFNLSACRDTSGLERMVQFTAGMQNIRDVIPFPRTPGRAEF